jgi:solute carrier family 20 (sodium-dependent phosphate transporter)
MFTWILVTGIFFTFYNAWGGGANDCANSFATAVGSKTLTLKQAIFIASIFEFLGAFLMGSQVTDTVRKRIVDLDVFEDNPGALMFGMLCANLSSAIWLTVATYLKWPVSTTHSIIGAIVGFSLAYAGEGAVVWDKIGYIVVSWFLSPIIAGIFSLLFFTIIKKYVFESNNSLQRTERIFPILTFFTFFINSLFIIYKGTPQFDLDDIPIWQTILISLGIGLFTSIISWYIYLPYAKRKLDQEFNSIEMVEINVEENQEEHPEEIQNTEDIILTEMRTISYNNALERLTEEEILDNDIEFHSTKLNDLVQLKDDNKIKKLHENAYEIDPKSDKLCSWLQIFTSCFSSFSHGSNDVANAIAPLASIFAIYETNSIRSNAPVPLWILALGGVGIVFGLATWGYKIINRIGRELTKVSPSRGFIIELSAALTIIIASRAELPVSTTHCQVGSVVGCGLSNGKKNIQWKLLKGIVWSWFITLPVTGFLSAALFSYGYFAPSQYTSNVTYLE